MANEIFTSAAVAAAVSGIIAYVARKVFEHKLSQQLESLKSELAQHRIYVEKIAALQTDNFNDIASVVYRIRNAARDIERHLPSLKPEAQSTLRDLALRLVEMLYEARLLLRDDIFERVHDYKNAVQNFIFSCNRIAEDGDKNRTEWVNSARSDYQRLDELYKQLTPQLQKELHITGKP